MILIMNWDLYYKNHFKQPILSSTYSYVCCYFLTQILFTHLFFNPFLYYNYFTSLQRKYVQPIRFPIISNARILAIFANYSMVFLLVFDFFLTGFGLAKHLLKLFNFRDIGSPQLFSESVKRKYNPKSFCCINYLFKRYGIPLNWHDNKCQFRFFPFFSFPSL